MVFADVAQLHALKQSLQGMTSVRPREPEPPPRTAICFASKLPCTHARVRPVLAAGRRRQKRARQ
jgi:hypothetical protein